MSLRSRLTAPLVALVLSLLVPGVAAAADGDTPGEAWFFNDPGTGLGTGYIHASNNSDVDDAADFFCGDLNFGAEQWYQFYPHRPGKVSAHLTSSDFVTVVMIVPFNPATGDPDYSRSSCSSEVGGTPDNAYVTGYDVAEGGSYYVLLGSGDTNDDGFVSEGNYSIGLTYDPDTDRDGIRDSADGCDGTQGPASNGGCPVQPPVVVQPGPGAINAKAKLKPAGYNKRVGNHYISLGIKVKYLKVGGVPKGGKAVLKCSRHACKTQTKSRKTSAGTVEFKAMRRKKLRAGTVLKIYVTAPNRVGTYVKYRILRNDFRRITRCLKPGSKTTFKC